MVNLYRIAQQIIAEKQAFRKRFAGMNEGQYNKLNYELHEEHILELEHSYIQLCKVYGDEPNLEALEW